MKQIYVLSENIKRERKSKLFEIILFSTIGLFCLLLIAIIYGFIDIFSKMQFSSFASLEYPTSFNTLFYFAIIAISVVVSHIFSIRLTKSAFLSFRKRYFVAFKVFLNNLYYFPLYIIGLVIIGLLIDISAMTLVFILLSLLIFKQTFVFTHKYLSFVNEDFESHFKAAINLGSTEENAFNYTKSTIDKKVVLGFLAKRAGISSGEISVLWLIYFYFRTSDGGKLFQLELFSELYKSNYYSLPLETLSFINLNYLIVFTISISLIIIGTFIEELGNNNIKY